MTQINEPQRFGHFDMAAEAPAQTRADFIRRVYLHLAGAVGFFILLETLIFSYADVEAITRLMFGSGHMGWIVVLAAFMGVSWLARWWANSDASPALQYAGLGLYVVAQSILFVPLLAIAAAFYPGAILTAGLSTVAIFSGLTAFVLISGKNFS